MERHGQHRNPTGTPGYFTTTFFHLPDKLAAALVSAGFVLHGVLAIEGPGTALRDLDPWWHDERRRALLPRLIARVEREPSLLGLSGYLMGIAHRAGA